MKAKTNKKRFATSLLVIVMAFVLLFSVTADAATNYAYSDSGYVKQLGSIDLNHKQYLDSSVMYRLPESISDNQHISVIVMLDNPALIDTYDASGKLTFSEYLKSEEADAIRSDMKTEKTAITEKLNEKGVKYSLGAEYSNVLSGFEIVIAAHYFDELCTSLTANALPVISEVYKKAETQLVENDVNVYETGIFDSSSFKYDGSGMVIAVLDTGLDYTHSAFSTDNFTSKVLGLTKSEVAAVLNKTNAYGSVSGLLADDVYVSDKVPFAFDYADVDSDVYSIHNNHGTHVSGVIAGKDDVITGVAPNAQIVSMKIFSDTYESAYASWILAALEDCVALNVDVINMSLGTACGFSRESDEEIISGVYDNIREKGISLVVAASNSYNSAHGSEKNGNLGLTSNPDTGTVGSPSTYDGALSIASISGTKTPYILYNNTIVYFLEATDSAGEEKNFFDQILPKGTDKMDMEYVVIPGAGRPADYTGLDVTGKIALVRRGSTTFEEKANAAYEKGAAGVIIYNNTSGEIRMNAGITGIPICSISQNDGEMLASVGSGTITISKTQASGPFISDFSSWGPTPDLGIKPEITAHGGNILSAVTGGEYDRLSGTSMACPNMAGVVALLRQYVIEEYPNKAQITNENGTYDYVEINAIVNRLMMSTADIIYNKNGLPYAVRKQGAGLANLTSSAETAAYIITYDRADGSVSDKSKIELGDDPTKSGEYTLNFSVYNFGTSALSYDISTIVMTEGVYETLTHKGDTTVTEEGYLLEGATVTVSGNSVAVKDGKSTLTVAAGATASVTVKIKLSDANKKYLDDSFKNGMYVEGFVVLEAVGGTEIDMSVPYLAFYGDWTVAPMFDLEYYETSADELDDSIETLDKTLPDAYATRPIGGVENDYINYLGSYYFIQNPNDKIISASKEYIAISNVEGTVHSLRFVWAGMLRNAAKIAITITDDATGEVILEKVDENIRKSYSDGGSYIYPASIDIEFDAKEYNLKNNATYTVKLVGYLDYGDGGLTTNENNTFEFPLTVDFEAPALTDVEFFTEYDKNAKKNRLYVKLAVYDNHYSMAMNLGYITEAPEDSDYDTIMNSFSTYLTPIYSTKDSTTYVTYELTDYIYDIKGNSISAQTTPNRNTFAVSLYDYAMNNATYEVPLPDEYIDFFFENQEITLSPNEVYSLSALVYPSDKWGEFLEYTVSNRKVARVVNDKLVAIAPGKCTVTVYNPEDPNTSEVRLSVTVLAEGEDGYRKISKPVADTFDVVGYETLKAYYQLAGEDQDIGETGDIRVFNNSYYSLKLFPSESVELALRKALYFPDTTKVVFESGNEKVVKVDENGVIVAVAKGYASITVRLVMDGKNTNYAKTISIEVKDPYIRTGAQLTHYFGAGGQVIIPDNLLFTEIGQYAFSNFNYVPKDLSAGDVITKDDPDTTKIMYIGDSTITKVVIPEGVEKIGPYAFANLTALTEVVLPKSLKYIEYGAFYGCSKLTSVKGLENVVTINKYAFFGCDIKGTISLDSAHAIADDAFGMNRSLKGVVISETLRSIGAYAFYGNEKLETLTIKAAKIKLGDYAFAGCASLTEVRINANVIPSGAFYSCKKLEEVTIGRDVNAIGEYAFASTAISSFTVESGNSQYASQESGKYLLNRAGDTILAVAPAVTGIFEITNDKIVNIGEGVFSGNEAITAVIIPSVKSVGSYAFADCTSLKTVTLGALEDIGSYAFFNTAISATPDISGVDTIGDYAFGYTDITSVTILPGVTVGEGAFTECQSLATVVIGDDAKLGFGAFMLSVNADHTRTGKSNWKITKLPGEKYFSYEYLSPLTSLTIGDRVEIGGSAFFGAAKLTTVTLGEGVIIGEQAFYNAASLQSVVNLGKAKSIGRLAFSGDVNYQFADNNFANYAIEGGYYVYKYYTPTFTAIDISGLVDEGEIKALGNEAFRYCRMLESVTLGDSLTTVPYMAFADCISLKSINLSKVKEIGEGAFSATVLESADLSAATVVGNYAFVNCEKLASLKLNAEGTDIGEGAFAYCTSLVNIENLSKVKNIDSYAFAYIPFANLDLSSAVSIGDLAFIKENVTPVTLKLTESIKSLGDNPFAMCVIAPLTSTVVEEFNGVKYESTTYTFDISETVKVIDGAIYATVPYGLELITYTGHNASHLILPENTVRISAMAFAGSDIVMVTLPHALNSIGHKAFFACHSLKTVVFKSYEAPNLEEEFDQAYYESYENLPATGVYSFQYYDGTQVDHLGLEVVPFYMIDAYSHPSNTYYGATFVDNIGHTSGGLIMVRPCNGQYYDTFIFGQYFDVVIDGGIVADDITMAAIEAINALPTPVQLSDEALVIAARAAYNKIALAEQRALVTNYGVLQTAEARIAAFKNTGAGDENDGPVDEPIETTPVRVIVLTVFVIVEAVIILLGAAAVAYYFLVYKKRGNTLPEAEEAEGDSSESAEATTEEADAEDVTNTENENEPKAADTESSEDGTPDGESDDRKEV
ncbi:MAG: leucine-rich repeat protein [Clostridia bacterium]|nr:leucine-rich repeat protein [Clostridia bacterium]